MLSTENRVIVACGVAALVLGYGVLAVTDLPTWAGIAVVLGVGVVLPQIVIDRLDDPA
ncbi:hypothetical protein ACFQE8_13775 [Salinirubellus sp. GCM10025818]|uniref:hypothetical protein n=1 Tax=Salinirubellus TaxID=2162630 RepID=UPI0030CC7F72